jgi:hypothetical protein
MTRHRVGAAVVAEVAVAAIATAGIESYLEV